MLIFLQAASSEIMFSYERECVTLPKRLAQAILQNHLKDEVVSISNLPRPSGIADRTIFNFLKGMACRKGLQIFSLEDQLKYLALAQYWNMKTLFGLDRFDMVEETVLAFCELIRHYSQLTYSIGIKDARALGILVSQLRFMNVRNIKGLWAELKEENENTKHERLLLIDMESVFQILDKLLFLRRLTICARLEDSHIQMLFSKFKEMKSLEKIELKGCFKDTDAITQFFCAHSLPTLKKVSLSGNFNAHNARNLLKALLDPRLNLSCVSLSGLFEVSEVWKQSRMLPPHIRSFKINDEKYTNAVQPARAQSSDLESEEETPQGEEVEEASASEKETISESLE